MTKRTAILSLVVLALMIPLVPILSKLLLSNSALVEAIRPLSRSKASASIERQPATLLVSDDVETTPALKRARGIYRLLQGDTSDGLSDLWATVEANPQDDRHLLVLIGFFNRSNAWTRQVPAVPLALEDQWNLLFESLNPLVIAGFAWGPDKGNYLQYQGIPVGNEGSLLRMAIEGRILNESARSCSVSPRIVFWTGDLFLSESAVPHLVKDKFAIDYQFEPPSGATRLTPRISISDCLTSGQKIEIDSVGLYAVP